MTGYIKYFVNGGKNMSFVTKDDDVLEKYREIWDKIKERLCINFHSTPVLYWKNTMKFGTRLKRHYALNFIAHLFMMKNT